MRINDVAFDLYGSLGIDKDKLGCVMLDLEPNNIGSRIPPKLLYYDPEKPNDYGVETDPHVTLLYGLLTNANAIKDQVDYVLAEWPTPRVLRLDTEVLVWPNQDTMCDVLVAEVIDNGLLQHAHQQLSMLPHINTFPTYRPHVTIAYCKLGMGATAKHFLRMEGFVKTTTLNYGHLPE